jgi:phenylpropionate dioxygenase-like ring-hydroxylating dioxygenase large terminal subunit
VIDVDDLVRTDRVHRRLYTDPDVFDVEMTRVFAASWCFVAHESQIPDVGDYVTATVGRRPVIVSRGSDGEIHAVLNRCTHRGALLVHDGPGCAKRFSCPYHGWTFANDGRIVGLPFPADHPASASGARSHFDLGRLAVANHRGFVFATLHPDPPTIEAWLGPARPWFDLLIDRHPGGAVAVAPSPQVFEFAGNWKLSWDNAADGIHATFAHRSYNTLGRATDTDTVLERDAAVSPMLARALGNGHMVVDQRPGIPQGPWATMRPTPFSEELTDSFLVGGGDSADLDLATGSMVNLSLFPNLLFVGNQMLVVEPVAVDRTRLQLWLLTAPGAAPEIDLLRQRVDEDFVSFGTPDDLDMFERVQAGLAIPELEWIDVSRGLDDGGDRRDADGVVTGPITSEAPQRGYLSAYAEAMRTAVETRAR